MKISRRGSSADFGQSSIQFKNPSVSWVEKDNCLNISCSRVKDFSTDSHHDYTASLTTEDIENLLKTISSAAIKNPTIFEQHLSSSLKSILQLQAVASGTYCPTHPSSGTR